MSNDLVVVLGSPVFPRGMLYGSIAHRFSYQMSQVDYKFVRYAWGALPFYKGNPIDIYNIYVYYMAL